jgi:hypothetical protein
MAEMGEGRRHFIGDGAAEAASGDVHDSPDADSDLRNGGAAALREVTADAGNLFVNGAAWRQAPGIVRAKSVYDDLTVAGPRSASRLTGG